MTVKHNFLSYVKECNKIMNNPVLSDEETYRQLEDTFHNWIHKSVRNIVPADEVMSYE